MPLIQRESRSLRVTEKEEIVMSRWRDEDNTIEWDGRCLAEGCDNEVYESRGRERVSHGSHEPETVGSSPTPAITMQPELFCNSCLREMRDRWSKLK